MAFNNPSANFKWALPRIGGDIGLWGAKLNEIIGGDGTISDEDDPLGIDGVIALIQADVDTAETDLADLDTRVTAIEDAGVGATYARIHRTAGAGDLAIPQNTEQRVEFDGTDFDQGPMTDVAHTLTIPVGDAGLFQLRAVLKVKFHSDGDDAFRYEVKIRRTRAGTPTTIGFTHTPFLNDGVSGSSGDITLIVEAIDVAEDEDAYEVLVLCEEDGSSPVGAVRGGATETYFEAARLAPTS